ncbi:hypothetical protein ElyMa_000908600 [Elysia marginata]|uniref:G-protein coupled receptors family 1 profile domain-containing protein n=1 Tax=Elysia marginata TaxID=1093978 RepID=A0AAV4HB83_9GAST|nr:hypothetical protein ElyMa_000908600 [Elysia marginata]
MSLGSTLGFILTYISALVLAVFNFAAVFYPHVFYKREMLRPAGAAILASWIVGLLVSVLAVGFDTPTQTKCHPVPLMPRYGILTLVLTCLLCTVFIVVLNVRMVMYFRTFRIHSCIPLNESTNQPLQRLGSDVKDPTPIKAEPQDRRRPLTQALRSCDQEQVNVVLTNVKNLRATPEQSQPNSWSSEAESDSTSFSQTNLRETAMDVFVAEVDLQAEGSPPDVACQTLSSDTHSIKTSTEFLDNLSVMTESPKPPTALDIDYNRPSDQHRNMVPPLMRKTGPRIPQGSNWMNQSNDKVTSHLFPQRQAVALCFTNPPRSTADERHRYTLVSRTTRQAAASTEQKPIFTSNK